MNNFYNTEAKRKSISPLSLPIDAWSFELLAVNICSLSWPDIEAAGLMSYPLWLHSDIELRNSNPVTSYSGLAATRLLRASCGQTSHTNLYQPANNDCYLFDNLSKLDFIQHLMMGHDGRFGGFLKEIRENGGMQSESMDQINLLVILLGSDGSLVYDDTAVLNRWLDVAEKDRDSRSATFYNTLPLHDGNHYPGVSKTVDYKARAQKFFDELDASFTELEKSGRKVMAVVVPEHDDALKGDRMQVSGLRDILNPPITNALAGVKFFGTKAPHQGAPIVIDQPNSFLAISDLAARVFDGKIFSEDNVDWKEPTSGLPQTVSVSENPNAIVIQYQDKSYVHLSGGDWVPYPQ